mmetsp:Transcript_89960/g.160113  ORF Transcript_89960/g.160113 Transcript_89960/m.160113 type:complete len:331 (+) Transcript_89960:87-1079(+)
MPRSAPQASWDSEAAEAVSPVDNQRMSPDDGTWAVSRAVVQSEIRERQAPSFLGTRRSAPFQRAAAALNNLFGLSGLSASQEQSIESIQAEDFGITYGVPTGDAEVLKAVQWVVSLSALSAAYYVITFIARLVTGQFTDPRDSNSPDELWSGCSQLVIELSIPACGYYGALYTHRTLIFFFCGANLIFVVASMIIFFRFLIRIGGTIEMCEMEQYASAQSDCEVIHSEGPAKYIYVFSLVLLMLFGCLSFGAGKYLYQGLGPADPLQIPFQTVPVVGEVIATPEGETQTAEGSVSVQIQNMSLNDENLQVTAMAARLANDAAAAARRQQH